MTNNPWIGGTKTIFIMTLLITTLLIMTVLITTLLIMTLLIKTLHIVKMLIKINDGDIAFNDSTYNRFLL
jgi:hypothetical protein